MAGHPIDALVNVRVFRIEEFAVGGELAQLERNQFCSPLLLKIRFVQPGRGQGFDAADDEQVLQGASRKPAAMDLEHVGVESKLFGSHQLLQVDVYCQV